MNAPFFSSTFSAVSSFFVSRRRNVERNQENAQGRGIYRVSNNYAKYSTIVNPCESVRVLLFLSWYSCSIHGWMWFRRCMSCVCVNLLLNVHEDVKNSAIEEEVCNQSATERFVCEQRRNLLGTFNQILIKIASSQCFIYVTIRTEMKSRCVVKIELINFQLKTHLYLSNVNVKQLKNQLLRDNLVVSH